MDIIKMREKSLILSIVHVKITMITKWEKSYVIGAY